MKIKLLICSILLTFAARLFAQVDDFRSYETITLKDGAVISGYLKSQDIALIGKIPKVEIYANSIVRSIPKNIVANIIICEQTEISALDSLWIKWFDSNKQYVVNNKNKEYVSLNEIKLKENQPMPKWGDEPRKVKILASNTQVKYIEFPKKIYKISADLISKIGYVQPSKENYSVSEETISTRDHQKYTGQIAFMIPGKKLCLLPSINSNQSVTIDLKNILTRKCKGTDSFEEIITKSAFIERIYTVNNDEYIGFITYYNYGNTVDDVYVSMVDLQGKYCKILLKDIVKISREFNNYERLVKSKKSELVQNVIDKSVRDSVSQTMEKLADQRTNWRVNKSKNDNQQVVDICLEKENEVSLNGKLAIFSLAVDVKKKVFLSNECVMMNFQMNSDKRELILLMKDKSIYYDVMLIPAEIESFSKKKIEKMGLSDVYKDNWAYSSTATLYTFNLKDFFKKKISYLETRDSDDVVKRIYSNLSGVYALYSISNKKAVLINIL